METLVVDRGFLPVGVIDSYDAFCAAFTGRVIVVEHYDKVIRSVSDEYYLPAVVQASSQIKTRPRRAMFSNKAVFIRDGYECAYCLNKLRTSELTMDHVVPRSRGGKHNFNNVVTCCEECNRQKADKLCEEIGMWPQKIACTPLWPCMDEVPRQWREYLLG